jgi:hypothetical protein
MKAWNVIEMKKISVYKILLVTNSFRNVASIQFNQYIYIYIFLLIVHSDNRYNRVYIHPININYIII